ncbi:transposase family protein [Paraburkholderia sp. EG287A]|uniref:integrase catalytic domain-containing protein n=1 Tax=unclassified Paraburkholderia TaxID=2615204 RepID=UPI0034D1D38B
MIHVANNIERAAANSYLYDDEVIAYIDSPFELNVKYQGKNNRPVQYNWRQGFLVLTQSAIYLDDWFAQSSLIAQCKSNPGRFKREGVDVTSPPLEAAASAMKLVYRLRKAEEIDAVAARNRDYLRSYLVDGTKLPSGFRSDLADFFRSSAFATLEELEAAIPRRDVDAFNCAIANGLIVSDFNRVFVGDKSRFMVFRDRQSMETYQQAHVFDAQVHAASKWDTAEIRTGTRIVFSGKAFTVAVAGNLDVLLMPDDGSEPLPLKVSALAKAYKKGFVTVTSTPVDDRAIQFLDAPWRFVSTHAAKEAVDKLDLLERWERGDRSLEVTEAYSDRTYRTFRKKKRDALSAGTDLVAAFLSEKGKRGNRNPRLNSNVEGVLKKIFSERFESLRGPTKWEVFGEIDNELKEIGEKITKTTFLRRVRNLESTKTIGSREGEKAAYQAKPFYWVLKRDTPVHGEYPMQFVHIDHEELKIEVVAEETGESLGRPVLTLITCAFSRRVLGFYLSLRSPRYLSSMAALLDMIRRFGRVPDEIIFDGGADFGSRDFKWALSFLRIGERPRRTSACRDGSLIERMFGVSQMTFIFNLFGNTKLRVKGRQITKKTDPSSLAIHTLVELYDGLEKFFFDTYDKRRHGTLLMSPRQKFEIGMDRAGKRLGRLRRLDQCVPHIFPSVKGITRVIDYQRGVHANNRQYRNPRLERPRFDGVKAETRCHPLDHKRIYVWVEDEWYPMFEVPTGPDENTSDASVQACFEEKRVLYGRTLASQQDANAEVAGIVVEMQEKATLREKARRARAAKQGPASNSRPRLSASAPKVDAKGEGSTSESMAERLRRLRQEGYRGKRYP